MIPFARVRAEQPRLVIRYGCATAPSIVVHIKDRSHTIEFTTHSAISAGDAVVLSQLSERPEP